MSDRGPLRICIVVAYDLSEPGGVKHHAIELATALRARGDDVTVVGPSTSPVEGVVRFGGVTNVISNGSDNRLGLFVSPRSVWRYFRRNRFDVLHVHEPLLPSLPYWAIWSSGRTPRVATFHAFGEYRPALLRLATHGFSALQFPLIHRGIAVSPVAARYALSTWHRPLRIVPNGVRTDVFKPGPRPPGQPFRLLFVGRVSDERKGFRYLLGAFSELRRTGLDAELAVVGDNTSTMPLPNVPGVLYHGVVSRSRLVEEYQRCDVFVAPSTGQESFGIVLLEAMACGKPIICSDIPGYRNTVAGTLALMVRPSNVADLVGAVRDLSDRRNDLVNMGLRNRAYASVFDWARVAEDVRTEYTRAIEVQSNHSIRSRDRREARAEYPLPDARPLIGLPTLPGDHPR
jgi:phosphatidyl-myo-inositol alpha-mannosyltransferase